MSIKNLSELKKECSKFQKILVTGPCRSGTTLCCHVLIDLLGYPFIESYPHYEDSEQTEYYATNMVNFLTLNNKIPKFIVHGPHLHPYLHNCPEDALIVFMRRNPDDVDNSSHKIIDSNGTWNDEFYSEKMKNIMKYEDIESFDKMTYGQKTYFFWEKFQKSRVKNFIELDYDILKEHKLFIPKEKRVGFRERQWKLK